MKQTSILKRLLCMMLAVVLIAGNVIPVHAIADHAHSHLHSVQTGNGQSVSFTRVDNDAVSAGLTPNGQTLIKDESQYADSDLVRVSIVLSRSSTIDAGYSAMDIASNQAAMNYRQSLKQDQKNMVHQIEQATDSDLDVVWNLTLAANIISANVEYGQIETIRKLPGVKSVHLESQYIPYQVEDGTLTPNMATSGAQIGTAPVWAAGYTGAGMRIAVIDTGVDTDHQSLNAIAYEYALEQLAAAKGMSKDAYISSLDLLDAAEIATLVNELNVTVDPSNAYINSKIAFGYNYRDFDYDVTHDNDDQGDHGSHVAGIATANSWLTSDGSFGKALDHVLMQGVAPEAQLLAMKVFGKGGSPYDSDFFAAIEDAIVLGADAINLSLGSTAPGRGTHSNAQFQQIMDGLTRSGVVVSISAGNSGSWVESAANGGYLYATDVSMDTVGQPSAFTNSLSIASVENDGMVGYYFTVGGETIVYIEELFNSMNSLTALAGQQEYIFIDGVGTADDWEALKDVLPGKIAICSRGETTFVEKAQLAVEAGAAAVMIYNNVSGIIYLDMTDYWEDEPVVSLTKMQGAIIRQNSTPVYDNAGNLLYLTGTMNISDSIGKGEFSSEYFTMSDFSSWGVPGSLEMKPEITAPGGNIFSLEGLNPSGGAYAIKSGTSMASPQVAGMSALLLQYIYENDLETKTGLNVRHLAQSLLMSTATPLLASKDSYYSILQQGAGLANINYAINADSYIIMADDASSGAGDGKVKVELFDDPQRLGAYSATFTVHNLQAVQKALALNADFFIQAPISDGKYLYMDPSTMLVGMDIVWYVNGQVVLPVALVGMDFNGDGKVSASDGQALLDYATGAISSISNANKADVDNDGDIDSHDAYVFLRDISGISTVLPANGQTEIRVEFSLPQQLRDTLEETYPNGTYIQGYLFAETESTQEGVSGTSHSIPVLGFYGNWTDPGMFDVGQWPTYATGEDDRIPYIGVPRANDFQVRYAKDPNYHYSFGGNPLIPDSVYMPERNAFNNSDYIHGISFVAIRHANQSRVRVINQTTGDVLLNQKTGPVNMAYYYNDLVGWQNINMMLETNVSMKNTNEGDQISMEFTLVPEYYVDRNGNVAWDELGHGATMSTSFVIDNTAPELEGVSIDFLNNTMTIKASDNQYVAAAGLYNKTGTRCLAQTGAKQEIAPGESAEYTFSLDGINGKKFLVQVFDYAMNVSTYLIETQIGENAGVPDIIAYDLVQQHWTTFTKDYAYDYKVGTPKVAYADFVYYAATIAEHYVFASTSKGELYVMPEDDLSDTTFIVDLGVILYDMAYNKEDGNIYAVTEHGDLVTIDKLTGALTKIGKIGVSTNTLACNGKGVFYCNELGTGKVYSFTLQTMNAPTLLMEDPFLTRVDPITGADMGGTVGNMGMEYDPNTGMICWNSHCEVLVGSYITFAYYYEIDPNTGAFTRYNDFWHEMSCLMIPDLTGRTDSWTEPTENVTGVQLNKTNLSIIKGTTASLKANVQPWTAIDRSVTWSSANEAIATVDQNGVITGITPGTTTITATSNLDPSKSASCEVVVDLLYVTINGTVMDEDGSSMFYSWNMAEDDIWKPGASLPVTMTSATWSTYQNVYYIMDSTESVLMHKVDANGNLLATGPNEQGIPLWDMAYSTTFSSANQEMVSSIYYCYLLSPKDPMALDAVGFDMGSMCSYLVGITSFGSEVVEDADGNEYDTEHLVMLDNDGYIWHFWIYARESGGYDALYSIYKTTLKCEFPGDASMEHMYTSLMAGEDGNLYLSTFNGETNELYYMTFDSEDEQYNAVKIGDMGNNVWPATITSVTVNGTTNTNAAVPAPKYTMSSVEISQEELATASVGKNTFHADPTERAIKLGLLQQADYEVNAAGEDKTNPISLNGLIGTQSETDFTVSQSISKRVYYSYTVPADGTLSIDISALVNGASHEKWHIMFYADGPSSTSVTIDSVDPAPFAVTAGDEVILGIQLYDTSKWTAITGTVNFAVKLTTAGGTAPDPETPCTHTNATNTWQTDDADHWQICDSCGEKFNQGTHSYGSWVAGQKTCSTCKKVVTCQHSNAANTWQSDDAGHWQICDTCGDKFNQDTHSYQNGECTCGKADPNTGAQPNPNDTLVLGDNDLTSGSVYTYTVTANGRLQLQFSNMKDSSGTAVYDYAYTQGKRVKFLVNGNYIPSYANASKITVSQGDVVTVEVVSIDADTYTVKLNLSMLEPAASLALGDNAIAKDTDYSFIATQDGTVYTTIKELWCDGVYCSEASLESSVVLRINGAVVTGFQNSYAVKAGDEITVLLGTSFKGIPANAILNLSYDGFYQHPAGSRGNPYTLSYADCPTTTVQIPAKTAVWYKLSGFGEASYLTVTGENAYVIVSGYTYRESNGSLTVSAPVWIQIGNDGNVPATFGLSARMEEGSQGNPKDLEEGDNTVSLDRSDYYFYDFIAPRDGTVTLTVSGNNWKFWLDQYNTSGAAMITTIERAAKDNASGTVSLQLKLGESIVLKLGTLGSDWVSTGGTLNVSFYFVADGGSTECPHTTTRIENQKDPSCTSSGYTGDKVCTVCGAITEQGQSIPATGHTPGTAATCTKAQTCTVCGAVINPATGHTYVDGACKDCGAADPTINPDPEFMLVLGKNSLASGNVYTYTVTENGRLQLQFSNMKDSTGTAVYDYAYTQGKRVKFLVNGNYVPSYANATKVSVTQGDVVTIEVISLDADTYTVDLTLSMLAPASALVIGDNSIAKDTDYSFIAPQNGTLYTTIKELWYDGIYCSEASLASTVVFRINGVVVSSFRNSYQVKAGDEVTVLLGTSFKEAASAVMNLSYTGFYEHPAGSRGNPYILNYADCPTTTAQIPANSAVWYKLNGFGSGYYLTITGENAYVIISGSTYRATNGSLTIPAVTNLQIGNSGSAPATFGLSASIQEGTKDNPKDMVEGNNNVSLEPRGVYYYDFVAPQNGNVTFTVSGDNWGYVYTVLDANGAEISVSEQLYQYKGHSGTVELSLTTGQAVVVKLNTMNSSWQQPGGDLTVNFHFEATGEAPSCQHKNQAGQWLSDDNKHWQICDSCGEKFNEGTHSYQDGECVCGKIDPSSECEHSYGQWVNGKKTCSKCGKVVACQHPANTIKDQKEATCTEDGYTGDGYCTVCGLKVKLGEVIPAPGHDYQEGVCSVCGAVDPDYRPIIFKDITCDQDVTNGIISISWNAEKMTLVGITIYADYQSVVMGENYITFGYVAMEGIPAGAAIASLYFEVVDPADADITVAHKQINNQLPGGCAHIGTAGTPVIENEDPATCTEDGSYETVVYCTECGGEISRVVTTLPATDHSFTNYVNNGDGTKTALCDHGCGATDTLAAPGGTQTPGAAITSDVYFVGNGLIRRISAGTKVSELINGINEKPYIKVFSGDIEVSGDTVIGTGMVVKLVHGNTVMDVATVVVTGDTNGDGKISVTDMLAVKAHILDKSRLSGAAAVAADTNSDNTVSITDFIQVKAHILGKSAIAAN